MSDFTMSYLAEKVFVHRWPHDTPEWGHSVKNQLDDSINKKQGQKKVTIAGKSIRIEDFEFTFLKKIGISVPFFKDECTMIFEGQFGNLSAHAHITTKSKNFLDVFNQLISWRQKYFSKI